jgi:superfamily II DNA or RNA helicase
MIITRNVDSKLSSNLNFRLDNNIFMDVKYNKSDILRYCENLVNNKPVYNIKLNNNITLRDYQLEAIDLINTNSNCIIDLPTGLGKNIIIIHSLDINNKTLILVPRIILMEQLKEEILKHFPQYKNHIQLFGNNKNKKIKDNKNIIICVYNSIILLKDYFDKFDRIYIDEAHHIKKPLIYKDKYNNVNIEEIKDNEDYEEDSENKEKDCKNKENSENEEYDENEENSENEEDSENEEYNENEENNENKEDSENDDDSENDEEISYLNIIRSLSKYNNNVYLSATIDKIENFKYYNKDIRDMIDQNYLCDYNIKIPIFSNDPTNKNICEHLINKYKHIIIYCNSQKEGKQINKILNKLQQNSSEYIDCDTLTKKRNEIINKFKNGDLLFLVNVRILIEGFDAPITKGVCFLHMPSSKTNII